jgi:hypothetical protein
MLQIVHANKDFSKMRISIAKYVQRGARNVKMKSLVLNVNLDI